MAGTPCSLVLLLLICQVPLGSYSYSPISFSSQDFAFGLRNPRQLLDSRQPDQPQEQWLWHLTDVTFHGPQQNSRQGSRN